MIVGVPHEVKEGEARVAMTPDGVRELHAHGHRVLVERGAGEGSSIRDDEYAAAGAEIVAADDAWAAQLVVKVKEPQPDELDRLRADLILFTYLHLAASEELTRALVASGAACVAYETVETDNRALPLLAPVSVQAAPRKGDKKDSDKPTVAVFRSVPVVAKVASAIHTTTNPDVILRFLLLHKGDRCDELRRRTVIAQQRVHRHL